MSAFSLWELQKAIYQTLSGDGTLMALVSGVFDHVPENTAYPYVALGEGITEDRSTVTTGGSETVAQLRVASREGGRKQAAAIMERTHVLLHGSNLAVGGQSLVFIRFQSAEVRLLNDGITYMGLMRFRVLLEAT